MHECINSNWDVRVLKRQRTILLYERIIKLKDENKVFELSTAGHKLNEPKDIIKDSYRYIIYGSMVDPNLMDKTCSLSTSEITNFMYGNSGLIYDIYSDSIDTMCTDAAGG